MYAYTQQKYKEPSVPGHEVSLRSSLNSLQVTLNATARDSSSSTRAVTSAAMQDTLRNFDRYELLSLSLSARLWFRRLQDAFELQASAWGRSKHGNELRLEAKEFAQHITAVTSREFRAYRTQLKQGGLSKEAILKDLTHYNSIRGLEDGTTETDIFFDCLIGLPAKIKMGMNIPNTLPHGMQPYIPTSAAHFPKLAALNLFQDKVFVDIGCGLGRVLHFAALYGCKEAIGIEIDSTLADKAKKLLTKNNIQNAGILRADAQELQYAEGDVFFLYAPFFGVVNDRVVKKLERAGMSREITIIGHGPLDTGFNISDVFQPLEIPGGPFKVYRSH